jgi:hypothetical protein
MTTTRAEPTEQAHSSGGRARLANRPALVAAALAVASALVSLYWGLGGTRLIDTVGGSIERLARRGGAGPTLLALGAAAAKLVAAFVVLLLRLRPRSPGERRAVLNLNRLVGWVLTLYGLAQVIVGSLVLTGGIHASATTDEHALRWHVFLWDMWFLVWGLAVLRALKRYKKATATATKAASATG